MWCGVELRGINTKQMVATRHDNVTQTSCSRIKFLSSELVTALHFLAQASSMLKLYEWNRGVALVLRLKCWARLQHMRLMAIFCIWTLHCKS